MAASDDKMLDQTILKRRAEVQAGLTPLETVRSPVPLIFAVAIQQAGTQVRETVYVRALSADDAIKPFSNEWLTVRLAGDDESKDKVTIDLTMEEPTSVTPAQERPQLPRITMEEAMENARKHAIHVVFVDRVKHATILQDLVDILMVFHFMGHTADTYWTARDAACTMAIGAILRVIVSQALSQEEQFNKIQGYMVGSHGAFGSGAATLQLANWLDPITGRLKQDIAQALAASLSMSMRESEKSQQGDKK